MSTLGEAFASTLTPVTEEVTTDTPVVTLPTDNPDPEFVADVVTTEQSVDTQESLSQEDEDYLKSFAEGIGYSGELPTDKEGLDAFLHIANQQVSQYKEASEFYTSNETLKELAEYVKAGGTPQEFFAQDQESNIWGDVNIPEDEVEERERLIGHYLVDYKGMDVEEAEILINNYKEKGKFDPEFDKALKFFQTEEQTRNEQIRQNRQQEITDRTQQTQKYIEEITKEFDGGFAGVSVDASIVSKAKSLSLPDAKGAFGIGDIAAKLTTKQQAMVNIFATALTENKAFQYNPTAGTVNNRPKPISQIVSKAKPTATQTQVQSLSQFAQALRNKTSN